MRRGTRVGQAYIALTADGSGINDDIADSLDGVDFDEIGDRHGREYEERFKSHFDGIEESFGTFLRDLGKAIDTDDSLTMGIRNQVNDAFTGGDLDSLTEGIGRRLGQNLGTEMNQEIEKAVRNSVNDSLQKIGRDSNIDISDLLRSVDSGGGSISIIGPIMDRAEAEARKSMERQAREMVDVHSEALRENAERDREAVAQRYRLYDDMFRDIESREAESSRVYDALLRGEESRLERSLADRAQMEEDDARRRAADRERYEVEFGRLLEQQDAQRARQAQHAAEDQARADQEADDDRYRHFQQAARRMLERVRFNPQIDRAAITSTIRRLGDDLEKESALRLRLSADLPARERTRIQEELSTIRARINVSVDEDALNRSLLRARQAAGDNDRFGDRIGGLLGAGSRNNFLNIIGKSLGGAINLTQSLTRKAVEMGSAFSTGFKAAEEGASIFTRLQGGVSGVSGSFSSLAASGPMAAVAIAVVAAAVLALTAVVGALLGIVTALAATIASALTGAALVAAGALGAVGIAAGLATIAFTSMTDAQKDALKADFAPLKQELTGIGQIILDDLLPYTAQWSENLQDALYQLTPLAQVFGRALGEVGNTLTASLSGPGFQMLTAQLAVFLPGIIDRLARALGSFLNGTAAVFSALLPTINTFAGYLASVAARFSAFATSASGQNAIVSFVDRAVASLQSLWNFIRETGGVIADLLFNPSVQNAGNSLFDSAANSLRRFRDFIARASADGSLERFFNDAKNFAEDLGSAIVDLIGFFRRLYNSGVLQGVGDSIRNFGKFLRIAGNVIGPFVSAAGGIAAVMGNTLTPILNVVDAIGGLIEKLESLANIDVGGILSSLSPLGLVGKLTGGGSSSTGGLDLGGVLGSTASKFGAGATPGLDALKKKIADNLASGTPTKGSVIQSGLDALNETSESNGGYRPDPEDPVTKEKKKPEYVNPYLGLANVILASAPTAEAQMRDALREVVKSVSRGIRDAAKATSADSVSSSLESLTDSLSSQGKQAIDTARQNIQAAAQTLASATNKQDALKALDDLKSTQKALKAAQKQQKAINKANDVIEAQQTSDPNRVKAILNALATGADPLAVQNKTLADFAEARAAVAQKITEANSKLEAAIAQRAAYAEQVKAGVVAYGNLLTAQAKVIDGVQQVLTADDIIENLQTRLQKIQEFRNNLRILLSQGLSNDAYQQLVDAGVEGGSAYADALVKGGAGAISAVNGLVAQVTAEGGALGSESSSRLYDAGVAAAQGLVDGLNSQSAALERAAANMGSAIAQAVKNALGIASPSKVMMDISENVGRTLTKGVNGQVKQVGAAGGRMGEALARRVAEETANIYTEQELIALGDRKASITSATPGAKGPAFLDSIAKTPEAAITDLLGRLPSANGGKDCNCQPQPPFRDLVVNTPTENPKAVAMEVLNEITGAL